MANALSQEQVALAFTSQTFQALQERGLIVLFVSTRHATYCHVRAPSVPAAAAQGRAVSLICLEKQQSHKAVVLTLHCLFLQLLKLQLSIVGFQLSGWLFLRSLPLIGDCENDRAGSD